MHPLLEQLRGAAPGWVSGEVLRQERGVSRMTVSKQVKRLVEAGYEIESSPRKGYRLLREPDGLTEIIMRPRLRHTRFERGRFVHKDATDSTNDDIRAMAREGAPEGSLVVAEIQNQGRGRLGRKWFGRTGDAVQMSLLLRPPLHPREGTLIPLLAAAAVYRALRSMNVPDVGIKWPNDVLIGDRKVCGVLCEMSVDMDRIEFAILGMGLNVNTPLRDFPVELRETACSLRSVTREPWSRARVMEAVLREMDPLLESAWTGRGECVLRAWREGSVTLGRSVEVRNSRGECLRGVAEDVDGTGALLLKDPMGQTHVLHSGEVSLNPRN